MKKCATPVTILNQFNFFSPADTLKPSSATASNLIDLIDADAYFGDSHLFGPSTFDNPKWPPDPDDVETPKWPPDPGEVEIFAWALGPEVTGKQRPKMSTDIQECATPVTNLNQFSFYVPADALEPFSAAVPSRIDLSVSDTYFEDPQFFGLGAVEAPKWPPDLGWIEF